MYPCGLTETRCLWPGISLGISVTQPAPPPCAPSDRPCTPTAHDAVVRAHRRDVDVDVNPGPATIGVVRLLDPPFVHFVEPVRRRGHDVENEPPKAEFATRPPRRTTGATAADHPGPAGSAP